MRLKSWFTAGVALFVFILAALGFSELFERANDFWKGVMMLAALPFSMVFIVLYEGMKKLFGDI